MAVLLDADFATDAEGFSAGSRIAAEGADFGIGYLNVPASTTASKSFTAVSSGVMRFDIWTWIDDTASAANDTLNTFIYLLPTAGAVSSANSITTFGFLRNTTGGATSSSVNATYRNNAGAFAALAPTFGRKCWVKLSIVANFTGKLFSIYVNDQLYIRNVAWANGSAADISRVVVLTQTSGVHRIDNVRVESDYAEPSESTLIDHDFVGGSGEIESTVPTTDARSEHPQLWKIADNTASHGAFTLGANGGVPDSNKLCFALQRCAAEGILEIEFRTSVSGNAYFGLIFRMWDYPSATNGGAGLLRIFGGSTNTYLFQLPGATGTAITVATGAFTPTADTIYTLKMEIRGRVMIGSVKAAAMDSGSYTTLFTHVASSSATGGRGMLSEELCGPFVATETGFGATDNYVRRMRFTGLNLANEIVKTVGPVTYQLSDGSVREMYLDSASAPTKNLFWSKGIQASHRSRADGIGSVRSSTIFNTTNCLAVRQKSGNLTEFEVVGDSDSYFTFLRRGPWVSDHVFAAVNSENFAPDLDFRPELWNKVYASCEASGGTTSRDNSSYHDWRVLGDTVDDLPRGFQTVSDYSSGDEMLLSQVIIPVTNATGTIWQLLDKFEGTGDPISKVLAIQTSNITAQTNYRCARAFLADIASSIDGTRLTDWRNDVASPATLSFTTGSAKTDAAGDDNADGFNERYGWYEINASGGAVQFENDTVARIKPAFRVYGLPAEFTIEKNATPLVSGTDYWVDDLGSGSHLLQFDADFAASDEIQISSGNIIPLIQHHRQLMGAC